MKRRGRGMACMWYPIGFTVAANPSAAVVKINEDGTATLLTGTVETGQGSLTILAQIVAQELGIATDDVHVVSADTDSTPMDTGAIASRTTYVTGNAAKMAAEKAKLTLFEVAAPLLGVKPTQLEAQDHKIFVKGFPQRNMHIGDVANHARVVSGTTADRQRLFQSGDVGVGSGNGPRQAIWHLRLCHADRRSGRGRRDRRSRGRPHCGFARLRHGHQSDAG